MVWILILYFGNASFYGGGGLSAEFNNKEDCYYAAQEIIKKIDMPISYVCVPKGKRKE